VLADQDEAASRRGITLELHGPDAAHLVGEPDDVRLVVRNLVANAIQYNRDGGRVDVRISSSGSELGPAWTVEVADTGIGIPQQDLQRIFERFYRVDVARSRKTGGTGLGLSIVRHAVERHRGTIRVESLLGQGTTFSVTLPARPPQEG
jgi:signal transduction histidine kinase